jgi:hypothetical protein
MTQKKIPGDRLVLALISAFRTLVFELSRKGVIDQDEFIAKLQETAITHRGAGDPNNLADAIHALSIHLQGSPDPYDLEHLLSSEGPACPSIDHRGKGRTGCRRGRTAPKSAPSSPRDISPSSSFVIVVISTTTFSKR